MRHLQDFENLTIKEIFVEILGEKVAIILLNEIKKAISEEKNVMELEQTVHDVLCKLNVTNFEVHEILHIVPQITKVTQITR